MRTEPAPPLDVPADASAAAIGDLAADFTPPHRSPRALVVERVRADVWPAGAVALALPAGGVDFAVTLPGDCCVGCALAAVAELPCGPVVVAAAGRGLAAFPADGAAVRLAVPVVERADERVAPLTVADAEPVLLVAGA